MRTRIALAMALATAGAAERAAAADADLILYNGKVLTIDPRFSIKSVIVVADGRIAAVGGNELLARYHAGRMVDLGGRVAMPGFMDTHFHPQAVPRHVIDASGFRSITDLQAAVAAKAKELGPGEWIHGIGWAEDKFAEKRNLTRADLDKAAPDNPVALLRAGGHSIAANSAALRLAHIDRNTPQPERGVIEHDADGEPNGIVRERINIFLPLFPPDKPEEVRAGYIQNLKWLESLGITSVIVASASIRDEVKEVVRPETFNVDVTYKQLRDIYSTDGADLPRAAVEITYPGVEALKAYPHKTGDGDTRLRLGAIGEAPGVDGGFTGPTAWTTQAYNGQPDFHGQAFFKDDADLKSVASGTAAAGWQLGLHAIGDAAINQAVRVYAQVIREQGLKDHRWYLAHFTMLPAQETMATMRRWGIWGAAQPNFLYTLEVRYRQTLSGRALEHNNPLALPLAQGVGLAFGSDNLPVDPRVGLYAAVTRKGPSGRVYAPEEALSIQEALRRYTASGPYLTWEEKVKGTLEPGKLADIIVLDSDPTTIPPEKLLTMRVDMTFIGGKLVYRRTP